MTETLSQNEELLLRRYLLGEVSGEEQHAIEQRVLTNQDYFYCLLRVEEGLIDDYVRGDIRGHEAQAFETRFVSNPERREDVKFAQALRGYLVDHSAQGQVSQAIVLPGWRLTLEIGLTCAVIVLGVISISLLHRVTNLRKQVNEVQLEADHRTEELNLKVKREQEIVANLRQQVAEAQSAGSDAATIVSLVLVPGLSRYADQAATVNLSTQTKRIRLTLQFDDRSYNAYHAEVQTVEGTPVWTQDRLVPRKGRDMGSEVELTLAARLLVRSDYLIVLNGANGVRVATYYLNVVRKPKMSRP